MASHKYDKKYCRHQEEQMSAMLVGTNGTPEPSQKIRPNLKSEGTTHKEMICGFQKAPSRRTQPPRWRLRTWLRRLKAASKADQDLAAAAEIWAWEAMKKADRILVDFRGFQAYAEELEAAGVEAFLIGFDGCKLLVGKKYLELDLSDIDSRDIDFLARKGGAGSSNTNNLG